eukprot:1136722-Pelagomonas_calceolata.AAC.8
MHTGDNYEDVFYTCSPPDLQAHPVSAADGHAHGGLRDGALALAQTDDMQALANDAVHALTEPGGPA